MVLVRSNGLGFGPCTIGVFVKSVTRSNGTVHAAFIKTERSDLRRQPFCFRRLRRGHYLLPRLPGACGKDGGRQDQRHHLCHGRPRQKAYYFEMFEARSEEHTSELQSLMRNSYAVFCLKKKKQ